MLHLIGGGIDVRTFDYQLIVWLSLSGNIDVRREGVISHAPIPVVIDSGCNFYFLINEEQFEAWISLDTRNALIFAGTRVGGSITDYQATLWLFHNVAGSTGIDDGQPPHSFLLQRISVAKPGSQYYRRWPLLGIRALKPGSLHLRFDGPREQFDIDAEERG